MEIEEKSGEPSPRLRKRALRFFHGLHFEVHRARVSAQNFSHFDEDRILARYISELLPEIKQGTAVDLGAGDGVRWSNTYALFTNGWSGVGVESDSRRFAKLARAYRHYPRVFACRNRISPDNVVAFLQSYEIPKDFEVLSIDVDGNDYWILHATLAKFRPRLIVAEINENIPPPIRFVVKYDPDFQLRHHFYGCSIMSLADLCRRYDYALLELEYNNAFLAPKEIVKVEPPDPETIYLRGYLERPDRKEKFALNFDLDEIHSMSPENAVKFLKDFHARENGKYFLSLEPIPDTK
jgi:hypothetical protein